MSGYDFAWEREWRVVGGLAFDLSDVEFLILPVGTAQEVFEHPAPGVRTLPSNAVDFWANVVEVLGDDVDAYIDEFLQSFIDPVEFLPWDNGGYVWLVQGYDTEDLVDDLFVNRLPDELRLALVSRLNEIAPTWLDRVEAEQYYVAWDQ